MSDDPWPAPNLADLAAATPEETAEALSYAPRCDECGPYRGGWSFAAGLAADCLTDPLPRSGFVIIYARSSRRHNAG